ncbi:hypothetical protein [Parabacteroides merdae]|jgi:hypothetical protein|uniref:hypothetical protein n=1 Tax=Parabacteroides merdae TaxID=46503 RepID=UPI0034A58EA4
MKVYSVYETDAWHSRSSMVLAGVYLNEKEAIDDIIKYHDIRASDIIEDISDLTPEEIREECASVLRII